MTQYHETQKQGVLEIHQKFAIAWELVVFNEEKFFAENPGAACKAFQDNPRNLTCKVVVRRSANENFPPAIGRSDFSIPNRHLENVQEVERIINSNCIHELTEINPDVASLLVSAVA